MKEFYVLFDHLKSLYDNGLYEDVKVLADLLIGISESSSQNTASFFSSSTSISATSSTSSINNTGTNFASAPFQCDSKDKYMIYYLYGNAAFNLREFKLAESLFNKALQINKSNLRPKPKTLTSLVNNFKIQIKIGFFYLLSQIKGFRNGHLYQIQFTSMLIL